MTEQDAYAIVHDTFDDDTIDDAMLECLFEAIYGRKAEDEERDDGLWSHICAATPGLCGCSIRAQHERGDCQR